MWDDVDLTPARSKPGFDNRAFFDACNTIWCGNKQARLEKERRAGNFLDKFTQEDFGQLIFRDDAVTKRADDFNGIRDTTHHSQSRGAIFDQLHFVDDDRDDSRFLMKDLIPFRDLCVKSAEVNA